MHYAYLLPTRTRRNITAKRSTRTIKSNTMKSRRVYEDPFDSRPINWDNHQVVATTLEGIVVLTNGRHEGVHFEGTKLTSTNDDIFQVGNFSKTWVKSLFEPLATVSIKFDS